MINKNTCKQSWAVYKNMSNEHCEIILTEVSDMYYNVTIQKPKKTEISFNLDMDDLGALIAVYTNRVLE